MDANRSWYLEVKENVKSFSQALEQKINEVDVIERVKISRINRDIRFSPNKNPYKDFMWCHYIRFGRERRGGFIFCIEPGGLSFSGGGFYSPNKEDLLRIRKEFTIDTKTIHTVLGNSDFKNVFGSLKGERVKTVPRGFDKDVDNIELVRMKQFYASRNYTDDEVVRADFLDRIYESYTAIRPFFDYMSEVLTTNLNGERII